VKSFSTQITVPIPFENNLRMIVKLKLAGTAPSRRLQNLFILGNTDLIYVILSGLSSLSEVYYSLFHYDGLKISLILQIFYAKIELKSSPIMTYM
jgi:hypothetical protein